MIGFSLGGVVSFNCMKILKRLNDNINKKAGHILNDVQLWAAAYVIDLTQTYQEKKEKSQNCTVVNGNLNNLWSYNDTALRVMMPKIFKTQGRAIGIYPIFEDIKDADKDTCKLAVNYDFTIDAPGHGYYGHNCDKFLHKVKDAF